MRFLTPLVILNLLAIAGTAQAQTAYGGPTATAPSGLAGIAPSTSRTAPSDDDPSRVFVGRTASLGAGSIAGDRRPSAHFEKQQRAIDRETIICTGCD